MKVFLTTAALSLVTCVNAQASFVTITQCGSSSSTHSLRLDQEGNDVVASLDNKKYMSWGQLDAEGAEKKKYKVTGRNVTLAKVADITLAELRDSKQATRLVASMMFSRRDFDGEYDMVYTYASQLVHDLECK